MKGKLIALVLVLIGCGTPDSQTTDAGPDAHDSGSSDADTAYEEDAADADDMGDASDAADASDSSDSSDSSDAIDASDADDDSPPPDPWPPEELTLGPDPQPSGNGWRTAQWNVCTTAMDDARLECRARISPEDSGRTAVQLERAAIAQYFTEDANLYSFTLQEICEEDARWIAAFVANGGPPTAGWRHDFDGAEYERIDQSAPYAFLPYLTHEMAGTRDYGCGVGVSTGVAVIAKRIPESTGLKLQGLTNASYPERAATGLFAAELATPEICDFFFDAQTSYDSGGPGGQYEYVDDFRSAGCVSTIPDTLRALVCVRTRWQGPGDESSYRVSTCATHAVHRGASTWFVRNHQIDEAGTRVFEFAGGETMRVLFSGDYNVVANRSAFGNLESEEVGHHSILSAAAHGFTKLTVGDHDRSDSTGTHRNGCGREIDAIYGRNAWWLQSIVPHPTLCRDFPEEEPLAHGPSANPFEWSDHEMMVSPLMSPHGSGDSDL